MDALLKPPGLTLGALTAATAPVTSVMGTVVEGIKPTLLRARIGGPPT